MVDMPGAGHYYNNEENGLLLNRKREYMQTYELIAPCHFGLEAVLKREIIDLGYDVSRVEDGRVYFIGDMEAICRANVFLRTAERILLLVGQFQAYSFDELFEKTKALDWGEFIPADGKCWVKKATSVKSKLYSIPDIQSIMKKAIVEKMKAVHKIEVIPETEAAYPLRVTLLKDTVTVALDTSGDSLHKRGYRGTFVKAPISETLAAALILLTPWKKDRVLVDPFCGSGTFPIEAAMIASNMAPGMNRNFQAEQWKNLIGRKLWYDTINEANDVMEKQIKTDIQGYDIDPAAVRIARQGAERAGVEHLIHFQQRPVSQLSHPKAYGFLITNPPYGERIGEKEELPNIYGDLGRRFAALDRWSAFVITSYEEAEHYMGRKADKKRKIYNGMMKTTFYQFMGPKPPRKEA